MCLVGFGVGLIRVDMSELILTHWVKTNKSLYLSSEP